VPPFDPLTFLDFPLHRLDRLTHEAAEQWDEHPFELHDWLIHEQTPNVELTTFS
jgi:hypothetical protein